MRGRPIDDQRLDGVDDREPVGGVAKQRADNVEHHPRLILEAPGASLADAAMHEREGLAPAEYQLAPYEAAAGEGVSVHLHPDADKSLILDQGHAPDDSVAAAAPQTRRARCETADYSAAAKRGAARRKLRQERRLAAIAAEPLPSPPRGTARGDFSPGEIIARIAAREAAET